MGCPNYTNSTLILLHYPKTTCTMTEPLQKNFPSGVKRVKFPPDINMLWVRKLEEVTSWYNIEVHICSCQNFCSHDLNSRNLPLVKSSTIKVKYHVCFITSHGLPTENWSQIQSHDALSSQNIAFINHYLS